MEYSDDWCFFTDAGKKKIGISKPDLHSSQLVSVNNLFGYVFFIDISALIIVKSSQIEAFFTAEAVSKQIQFDSPIIQVASDDLGKTIAVCCGKELHWLAFKEAIAGTKQEKVTIFASDVRKIEWAKERLALLCVDSRLEVLDNNVKIGEKEGIQAFAFVSFEKAVVCSQDSMLLVTVPEFNTLTQVSSLSSPLGLFAFNDKILKSSTEGTKILLDFFTKELKHINNIENFDAFPMSPDPSLETSLEQLPLTSFSYYFPSRDTLFFSSTCSALIDIIMNDSGYSLVSFEENLDGAFKVGWENGKECVFRGFAVITNYGQGSERFEYYWKDTTYSICQPPMVLCIGSNGVLMLRKFVDLRKGFENDDACKGQGVEEVKIVVEELKVPEKKKVEVLEDTQSKNPFFFAKPVEKPKENVNISGTLIPSTSAFFAKPLVPTENPGKVLAEPLQKTLQENFFKSPLSGPSSLIPPSVPAKSLFSIPESSYPLAKPLSNTNSLFTIPESAIPQPPTTISSNKISELNEIMRQIISDLQNSISTIALNKPLQVKLLETKSLEILENTKILTEKYFQKVNTINELYDNVDEIKQGVEYIAQAWESQLNNSTGHVNIDIHLVKAVEDSDKAIKLFRKIIENGIDQVVGKYLNSRNMLGIQKNLRNSTSTWKKTRSYCPVVKEDNVVGDKEAGEFLKRKIENLTEDMEILWGKTNLMCRVMRKKQQKVYNFNPSNWDEPLEKKKVNFADPNEYKLLFKDISKGRKKNS